MLACLALITLNVVVLLVALTNRMGKEMAKESQQTEGSQSDLSEDSLLAQIEPNLVKDHVRYAKAYLRVLEIYKERHFRSWLVPTEYTYEKNLGPVAKALTDAVTTNDQVLAQKAVTEIQRALVKYGVKLRGLSKGDSAARKNTGRLPLRECTAKDEATLSELKSTFASSLRIFKLNSTIETAEQAFIDGWIEISALGLIGPDYIGKYDEKGRKEVRHIKTELYVLQTELVSLGLNLKGDEYERVKNQSARIRRKTEELGTLLARF